MKTETLRRIRSGLKPHILTLAALLAAPCVFAQGTAFTYQGQLDDAGAPASGSYDLTFSVWSAASGGAQIGSPFSTYGVSVDGGLFSVNLDFGAGVFTGPDRWLEIGVQTNGGGGFTTLSPRTKVTASPYSVLAGSVPSGSIGSAQVLDNSLTAADLAVGSVGASEIATGAVGTLEVLDNSLTAADLAVGSVGASEVLDNSLTAADLANDSVTASEIAAGAVGTSEVADGSLTTADLNLTSIDARYVEVSGDTMTGKLVIQDSTDVLNLKATGDNPMMQFQTSTGSQKAWFQAFNNDLYLANTLAGNLHLRTGNQNRMTVDSNGDVGIGTTAPDTRLHLYHSGNDADLLIEDQYPFVDFDRTLAGGNSGLHFMNSGAHAGWLYVRGSDGVLTMSAGTAGSSQDDLTLSTGGLVGVGRVAAAAAFEVEGANTNDASDAMVVYNSAGTDLFHVENSGQVGIGNANPMAQLMITGDGVDPALRVQNGGSTKFSVNPNGGATIGTFSTAGSPDNGLYVYGGVQVGSATLPTGYKMSVDGKIACEEVLVQVSGSWPDYVFADNYNLRPLSEVEAHIKTNRHLPGIPKAAAVEGEGLSVGTMQKQMMEKIEELTLYILQQEKRIAELESRLAE